MIITRFFIPFACLSLYIGWQQPTQAQGKLHEILDDSAINWRNAEDRVRAVRRMKLAEDRDRPIARRIALQRGWQIRRKLADGRVREVIGLDENGEPLYVETRNDNAAISTGADLLHTSPYPLSGHGVTVGVWDAGIALPSHQEFNDGPTSRINDKDGTSSDDHATHVAGTIAAFGVVPRAKGMAYQAEIDSYNWSNDWSEMAAAGATAPGQFGTKIYLSNHSYGYTDGWDWDGSKWRWLGTGTDQNAYDSNFGRYSFFSNNVDSIAQNTPYYLIFWSAGNERNDGPSNGNTVSIGGSDVTYNSSIHPPGDGVYRNGFETVADQAVGKNVMTVGAANDAVTNGLRDPIKGTITSFSSTGPTDDGRIKPDIVGNGRSLYSPEDANDTDYGSKSGTSMSSPNVCGSAALLVGLYRDLFGTNAAMRACTLKGLLIHTATDLGRPGPDYSYGWGLADVKTGADLLNDAAAFPMHPPIEGRSGFKRKQDRHPLLLLGRILPHPGNHFMDRSGGKLEQHS